MSTWTQKLFDAVAKGQTGSVSHYLKQGANINGRDQRDGRTPLLKAAQKRNFVMQKLLLFNGAKVNARDKEGLTAIHYAAEAGDVESVMLTLSYQASVHAKDAFGSTPLHYAANRGHILSADLLVFCGADCYAKNDMKMSCYKVCNRNNEMLEIIHESERITNGIRHRDILLQHYELSPDKTYDFETLGLRMRTSNKRRFDPDNISFLCRRTRPEYGSELFRPVKRELLISDTFEYRMSFTFNECWVELEVPLYECPDPFEDIVMKTDVNPEIISTSKIIEKSKIRRKKDENHLGELLWTCFIQIDLTKMRSFCLVTIPKKEFFPRRGEDAIHFKSEIDPYIQVTIPAKTFDYQGKYSVSLEVMPCPMYDEKHYQDIHSISHFYDLSHTRDEQPQKDCELQMPLPQDYGAEGIICLLGANLDSEYYLDMGDEDETDQEMLNHWHIVKKQEDVPGNTIKFPVDHFSIKVAAEVPIELDDIEIMLQTANLYKTASLRRCSVSFFVMVKPLGDEMFEAVVECMLTRNTKERMNCWSAERFMEQDPVFIGEFTAVPGKKYSIELSDNLEYLRKIDEVKLEFHPKRKNFTKFEIQMRDGEAGNTGQVFIREEVTDEILQPMNVILEGLPYVDNSSKKEKELMKGFCNDELLRYIATQLESEWSKVCLLMGLSYKTVEEYRNNNKITPLERKLQTLKSWRNMVKHRVDNGIPDLLSALRRNNRKDLVDHVYTKLSAWLEEKVDEPDSFYKWLEEALSNTSERPLEKERPPVPMSDQFFVIMMDQFGPPELGRLMHYYDFSEEELFDMFGEDLDTINDYSILKMLVDGREKHLNSAESLRVLMSAIEQEGMVDVKEWIVNSTKDWLKQTQNDPDPFREDIMNVIEGIAQRDNVAVNDDNEQGFSHENDNERIGGSTTKPMKDSVGSVDKNNTLQEPDENDNEDVSDLESLSGAPYSSSPFNTPGPARYNTSSQFGHGPSFIFNSVQRRGIQFTRNWEPGPGAYMPQRSFNETVRKPPMYSFGSKPTDNMEHGNCYVHAYAGVNAEVLHKRAPAYSFKGKRPNNVKVQQPS